MVAQHLWSDEERYSAIRTKHTQVGCRVDETD
jgi:hypothetical protein